MLGRGHPWRGEHGERVPRGGGADGAGSDPRRPANRRREGCRRRGRDPGPLRPGPAGRDGGGTAQRPRRPRLPGGRPPHRGFLRPRRWCPHRRGSPREADMTQPGGTPPSPTPAEAAPPWSAGIPELAYSLLSPEFGGASLLAFMDVPDESGILAGASLQAALALALADLSGSQMDPAALLAALGGQGETAAAYAASLLGRHGYAILLTPGGAARHVAFDPTAAGLRLVLMSARPDAGAPPRHRWAADPSDDARAGAGADAIAGQDWPGLGTLLTAA